MTGAPGGGRPLDEPDPDYDDPYDWLRGPRGHCGHQGRAGREVPPGPPGPLGPQGPAVPFSSTGMGDLPLLNLSTTTVGVENSLQYMGDSMNRLLEAHRYVNQTMVAHMNASTAAQETQSIALAQLVENTHQREFDKMFNAIPIYEGEDPDKFETWLEQLQNACRVGKHDIREVAMCCASGPVLEVLQSMDPILGWSKICDELQRCFSPNRTSARAVALLITFRKQNKNENLRSFIYQYTKLHAQATGMSPKDDYDLMRKVEFLKRLHNKFIGNKIIRSNAFKSYMTFSMADCFSKALELEGEYQVGKIVSPGIDLHVMSATGQLTGKEIHEASTSGNAEPE